MHTQLLEWDLKITLHMHCPLQRASPMLDQTSALASVVELLLLLPLSLVAVVV
jgi:hypothetical protein